MKTKICTKCGIEKELSKFTKQKSGRFGVHSYCQDCNNLRMKSYYNQNKDKKRNCTLKFDYGISLVQYNKMLKNQKGLCTICSKKEVGLNSRNKKVQKLSVDHNHATGKIRELLCSKCNHLLGLAGDNINTLEIAIQYLLKHKD